MWESRKLHAAGKIDYEEFMDRSCASVPSAGHCNTMGTALSMNSLTEALGMTLPGIRRHSRAVSRARPDGL